MPLPMVHLNIAKNIHDSGFKLNELSQFYLGIISPDAIHMRKESDRKTKNDTHLVPEGKKWIEIDESDYFTLMIKYINSNLNKANKDFLWGYGINILTDMLWTKQIYSEFLKKYKEDKLPIQEERMAYYNDTDRLDQELFNESSWRKDVWLDLQKATCESFLDLLLENEIYLWKERTLHWFDSGESRHKNPIKYITKTEINNYISDCTESIMKKINS